MYISVSSTDSIDYFKAIVEIASEKGKGQCLVYGTPPHDLCNKLLDHPVLKKLNFVSVDPKSDFSSTLFQRIDRQEISERTWDVLVICPDKVLHGILGELMTQSVIPDIVSHGKRADYMVLVSVQKGGTNLLHRLLPLLDYTVIGDGAKESYDAVCRKLKETSQTRRNHSLPFDFLVSNFGKPGIALSTHGMRLEPDITVRDIGGDICDFEGPTDISNGPLWRWLNDSYPPIVFNYRDPRDVLVSLVHYLLGEHSPNYWLMATASILKNLSTMHERLDYLIRCVPRYMDIAFRQHMWLFFHPAVCKVSFEELVGASGGGDEITQSWGVLRVLDHLSVHGDPMLIGPKLFSSKARTFRRGQIGEWKEAFSEQNMDEFNKRYRDILDIYGYSE